MKQRALVLVLLLASVVACEPADIVELAATSTPVASAAKIAASTATPRFPRPILASTPIRTATPIAYTVKPGDNLTQIADRFGTTVDAIAKANDIEDPSHIRVGQVLIIPVGSALVATATGPAGTAVVGRVWARVVRVIDGDTIEVEMGGQIYTVRYIGIDTPETKHPEKSVEWMGREAAAKNEELVGGMVVELEKDVSETDRYGRLLRYVWVGELMVNAELVRLGFATVSTYPPDVRRQDLFLQLQEEAREAGLGLWGVTPTVAAEAAATSTPLANCDPSYPDVCIAPPPPDLDCKDVPYQNFRVLQPDPHRFDGDKDGIGCEA